MPKLCMAKNVFRVYLVHRPCSDIIGAEPCRRFLRAWASDGGQLCHTPVRARHRSRVKTIVLREYHASLLSRGAAKPHGGSLQVIVWLKPDYQQKAASPAFLRMSTTDLKANQSGISSPLRRRLRNSVPESFTTFFPSFLAIDSST